MTALESRLSPYVAPAARAKSGGEDLALQDMEAAREDIADHSVCKSKDHDRSGRFGISETESKHSHQER